MAGDFKQVSLVGRALDWHALDYLGRTNTRGLKWDSMKVLALP